MKLYTQLILHSYTDVFHIIVNFPWTYTIFTLSDKSDLYQLVAILQKNNNVIIIFFYLSDIDECSRCFVKVDTHFFPFGNQTEDILSNLSDDGSTSILLSTGFIFYETTYTTVFVSCKLSNFHQDHLWKIDSLACIIFLEQIIILYLYM